MLEGLPEAEVYEARGSSADVYEAIIDGKKVAVKVGVARDGEYAPPETHVIDYMKNELKVAKEVGDIVGTEVYDRVTPVKDGKIATISGEPGGNHFAYAMEYVDGKFPSAVPKSWKVTPELYQKTVDLYYKLYQKGYSQGGLQFLIEQTPSRELRPRFIDFGSVGEARQGDWGLTLRQIELEFKPLERTFGTLVDPNYVPKAD